MDKYKSEILSKMITLNEEDFPPVNDCLEHHIHIKISEMMKWLAVDLTLFISRSKVNSIQIQYIFKFAHVRANCESFRHSFFYKKCLNTLPIDTVKAETTDGFK